jgi:hypothetical protein
VLRRVFGSKREDVVGEWRNFHNEINNLYSSLNIIMLIKSRRMTRADHVARMAEMKNAYNISVGTFKRKRSL